MGHSHRFGPRTDDFRSTSINRHRYRASACLKSAKVALASNSAPLSGRAKVSAGWKAIMALAAATGGVLFCPPPVFAHRGGRTGGCGNPWGRRSAKASRRTSTLGRPVPGPISERSISRNGLMRRSISLSSFKSTRRDGSLIAAIFFGLALCDRSFRRPPLDVDGCYEPFNLAAIADQPQTRTRRTRQPWPSQKRCVTHSQLPKSSYGPRPAP